MAGENRGEISNSYATGAVSNNGRGDGGRHYPVGGLVGTNYGTIRGSYATASVTGNSSSGSTHVYAGGLVGHNKAGGSIVASYATAAVSTNGAIAGGLVGQNDGNITASYAIGEMSATGGNAGGLVGRGVGEVTNGYWDTQTSGLSASAAGVGKTTAELQSPTGYTGIYADWNVDLDGDSNADDPWDFGTSCQYPVLKSGGLDPADQRAPCSPP